jgi:hypothetical protein
VKRGFAFPGEKGGAPESIIAHDLTHVLGGFDTDLPSEACVTAFQAAGVIHSGRVAFGGTHGVGRSSTPSTSGA